MILIVLAIAFLVHISGRNKETEKRLEHAISLAVVVFVIAAFLVVLLIKMPKYAIREGEVMRKIALTGEILIVGIIATALILPFAIVMALPTFLLSLSELAPLPVCVGYLCSRIIWEKRNQEALVQKAA